MPREFVNIGIVLLLGIVPYVIWLFTLTVTEGTKGTNKYGPDPLWVGSGRVLTKKIRPPALQDARAHARGRSAATTS